MPKLPMLETKASATPTVSVGVISGRMTVRKTVCVPAPAMRAASTASRGRLRSPARTVRKTSGACWMPSSSMMPSRE